ncbi:MAG: Na+/H+ antiporter NhaC family protein [Candidatus Rifleibacteriota bacterium]
MRNKKSLFFVILFLLTTINLSAKISIDVPSFTLTGIETDLIVKGLNLENDSPELYKVKINGETALSGVALEKEIQHLPVVFNNSGNNKIEIEIGNNKAEAKLRVIKGWLSVLPPLIAIILALITKEVISSLFVGIWFGAFLIYDFNPFIAFLRSLDRFLLEALADPGHASIVLFSCALGGMVGVINRTGGMQGIVNIISGLVRGPRSAQLATWLMGILIFFDDYANTLIVGNSMRPVTDSNRISREKLSYLVDSTAAPVAGVAVLSTWIGYEIGLIREAYIALGIPETNFYSVFLQTIPFRFYCILALFFGLMIALSRKDFGPMFTAEKRAGTEGKVLADDANPISSPEASAPELPESMPKRWYNAAIPIAIVLFGTFIGLLGDGGMFAPHYDLKSISDSKDEAFKKFEVTGVSPQTKILTCSGEEAGYIKIRYNEETANMLSDNDQQASVDAVESLQNGSVIYAELSESSMSTSEKVRIAFGGADSTRVLIWVSIIGSIIAILLGKVQGLIAFDEGAKAWVDGVRMLVMAICIMLLAWTINGICTELHTARYIVEMVTDVIPYWLLPSIIFILACFISFSTGTSWGTMAILLPISIPLSYHLNMQHYNEVIAMTPDAPEMMVYLKSMILVSIGAVLEGSIFGDHCSPISDTTIMSSMASGSDHIDHVKTQAPYALLVGLIAILICYIPAGLGFSPMFLLPVSMIILFAILYMFGKNSDAHNEVALNADSSE